MMKTKFVKLKSTPKNTKVIALLVIFAVIIVGSLLFVFSHAATPYTSYEAENGTGKSGAYAISDSQASGGRGVIFQGVTPNFVSKITTSSTKYHLEKGDYGSLTPLSKMGYTKMNLVQVADAATTSSTQCSFTTIDPKLRLRSGTTCEPYVSGSENWRQQGLTGVGNSGYAPGRSDILIVTWHYSTTKARITVLNKTTNKQAFVALVRPCSASSGYCDISSTDDCGNVHSDGAAWYKSNLFMADTNCIIVFNVNNVYKLSNGNMILPVSHFWHRTTTSLDYATLGLDISGSTPQLMTADYLAPEGEGCGGTPIVRYSLDPDTETLATDSGNANAATSDTTLITKKCLIQGIAYSHGMYYLVGLSGTGGKNDYLYRIRTKANAPEDTTYYMPPITPEGLYLDEQSGITWNLSEHGLTTDPSLQARIFSWETNSAMEAYPN